MKQTRVLLGMPIIVEIIGKASGRVFDEVFSYFAYIDEKFSVYKKTSEITSINKGKFKKEKYSADMKTVFRLSEETRKETGGYFNILKDGKYDPSSLVKGWAIFNAAKILGKKGFQNFYVEAGGDIQVVGNNARLNPPAGGWRIGIRNPFNQEEIVKVVVLTNQGIATSGTYIRGKHIYNPKAENTPADEIASMTVIAPNVYEADRFATAAFAMGKEGIYFLEKQKDLEGYMIDKDGIATMTSGWERYAT